MSCFGVLFSLDGDSVKQLHSFSSDNDRLKYFQKEIETSCSEEFPERMATLDKSWDGLHRSLTDGFLAYENGTFPLNHVIMGGEILYKKDDYIMTLKKTPQQVRQIATAVAGIDIIH